MNSETAIYNALIRRTDAFKHCQKMITLHIVSISRIQDSMFEMYGKDEEDRNFFDVEFYDTITLDYHQQLCAHLAKNHEKAFTSNIMDMIDAWRKTVEHGVDGYGRLDQASYFSCVKMMKYIAGFCLLEALYYEALLCLCELLRLQQGRDGSVLLLAISWAIRLEEWALVEHLLEFEMATRNVQKSEPYILLMDCFKLVWRLHTTDNITEQQQIGLDMAEKLRTLIVSRDFTLITAQTKCILRAALVHASRVPKADLNKLYDPLFNRDQEFASLRGILKLWHEGYQDSSKSSSLMQKVADAGEFCKLCSSFAEYQETALTYVWELLEAGLMREAEVNCLTLWREGLAFGLPLSALRPLSLLFHIKALTGIEPLDGYAKCINTLLTPPTASRMHYLNTPKRNIRPSSYRRGSAVDDSFNFEYFDVHGNEVSDMFALEMSSINIHRAEEIQQRCFHLEEHIPQCSCAFCDLRANNWLYEVELAWVRLLLGRHSEEHFAAFEQRMSALLDKKIRVWRFRLLSEMFGLIIPQTPPSARRGRPNNPPKALRANNNCGRNKNQRIGQSNGGAPKTDADLGDFFPLHFSRPYLCSATHFLLQLVENNNLRRISLHVRRAFELAKQSPLSYRAQWLLLKHVARLFTTKAQSSEQLVRLAYDDQKNYGHLLFIEWRRRNCSFLGTTESQQLSQWHRALYQIEATAPALRQMARMTLCMKAVWAELTSSIEPPDSVAPPQIPSSSDYDRHLLVMDTSEQVRTSISQMPSDITLVHIALADDQRTLVLTRCHCSHEPLVVKLLRIEKNDPVLDRMRELLLASDESVRATTGGNAALFWKRRNQLDLQMKEFVAEMQQNWFPNSAPLLLPLPPKSSETRMELLERLRIEQRCTAELGLSRGAAVTIVCLLDSLKRQEWERMVKLLFETAQSTMGAKEVAPSALKDFLECWVTFRERTESGRSQRCESKKYTLLVVPPSLSHLPWECLPIFRYAPLVSRMPCFHFYAHLLTRVNNIPKYVDGRNSYYVLNPGGDLERTEERMSKFMKQFDWEGLVGEVPTREQLRTVLAQHDLFLYMGHGSGSRYFGRSPIRESECRAVSILMGCSSLRIIDEGPGYDGRSPIHEYMIARCPCLVGCLWMVTDGEIDRFFIALIEYCFARLTNNEVKLETAKRSNRAKGGNQQKATTRHTFQNNFRLLIEGVVEARKRCKLPYLTGAAVVSYGLPVGASLLSGAFT